VGTAYAHASEKRGAVVKLPQVFALSPDEVRAALSDWITVNRIPPTEGRPWVYMSVVLLSDGGAHVTIDEPRPKVTQ